MFQEFLILLWDNASNGILALSGLQSLFKPSLLGRLSIHNISEKTIDVCPGQKVVLKDWVSLPFCGIQA